MLGVPPVRAGGGGLIRKYDYCCIDIDITHLQKYVQYQRSGNHEYMSEEQSKK